MRNEKETGSEAEIKKECMCRKSKFKFRFKNIKTNTSKPNSAPVPIQR